VIDLARSKLICQNDIDLGFEHVKNGGALAVVDVRLKLSYDTRCEFARSTVADQVASNMRVAFYVPQRRDFVVSDYSSEPLLAEAAAQQMHVFRFHDPDAILKIITNHTKSGLLDKGKCGELVARLLLTFAYDRAIEKEFKDLSPDSTGMGKSSALPFFSRGVSLITFIKELFVPHVAEEILNSFPNNLQNSESFGDAFKEAKVRFTHFGKMVDDMGTTSNATWGALVRAMAIITHPTELIDIIIPVLLWDTKLCEEVVTGILVQVKSRKRKGAVMKYEINEKQIQFFPPSAKDSRPYISLVMELGVQDLPSPGTVPKVKVKGKAMQNVVGPSSSKPPSKRVQGIRSNAKILQPGKTHHPGNDHPRYSIFAYGCSDAIYRSITRPQLEYYQFLLSIPEFLTSHPRPRDDVLSAVREMKPFWGIGKDFYSWLDDGVMNGENPSRILNLEPDGVVVAGLEVTIEDESSISSTAATTSSENIPRSTATAANSTRVSEPGTTTASPMASPQQPRPPTARNLAPSSAGHTISSNRSRARKQNPTSIK
jgi:hypothetical protein